MIENWTYSSGTPESAAATPVISETGAAVSAPLVSIVDSTPGATIYYTLDGSIPTASSTAYGGPFSITTTTTVNAVAIAQTSSPVQAQV